MRDLVGASVTFSLGVPAEILVAEGRGFEPRERLHARWFSRPVHSTTLPSLRRDSPFLTV